MMKLPSLLLTLLLLCGALAHAADCPPPPQAAQPPTGPAPDRGALWRLDKDGRSSYLYGSMHAGRAEWMLPGPKLTVALLATQLLALEVDAQDPALPAQLAQAMAALPPLPLEADDQARLDRQADVACVPRQALAGLHPMLQVSTLQMLAGRHEGLHLQFAQEAMLGAAARRLGRPVVALETAGQQLALLVPEDAALGRRLLREGLDHLESPRARQTLQRLARAWEAGDLALLGSPERLCDCQPTADEKAYLARLNDSRNPAMAQRIAELHGQGKPLLAAVGMLHMTGPQALPQLLQGLGFQVERLVP